MIIRIVEYGIRCDHPECRDSRTHVSSWQTKESCAKDKQAEGWVKCSRNRWLCPACAEKYLPKEIKK